MPVTTHTQTQRINTSIHHCCIPSSRRRPHDPTELVAPSRNFVVLLIFHPYLPIVAPSGKHEILRGGRGKNRQVHPRDGNPIASIWHRYANNRRAPRAAHLLVLSLLVLPFLYKTKAEALAGVPVARDPRVAVGRARPPGDTDPGAAARGARLIYLFSHFFLSCFFIRQRRNP